MGSKENKDRQKKQPCRELHGNQAKIDPKKHVESLFASNTVTMAGHRDQHPAVEDANVGDAKHFVDENKK